MTIYRGMEWLPEDSTRSLEFILDNIDDDTWHKESLIMQKGDKQSFCLVGWLTNALYQVSPDLLDGIDVACEWEVQGFIEDSPIGHVMMPIIRQEFKQEIENDYGEMEFLDFDGMPDFNDDRNTTLEDVKLVVKKSIYELEEKI